MRSDKYWAARAAKRMDYTMKDAQEISNRIGRAYNEALRDIQSQLDSIFRNFSAGISRAEAVRILNRVSIGRSSSVTDMLKQALDLVADPEDRAKLLAEINAPAYKYRMQRLKELAEDAGNKCAEIARTTRSELDGGLAGIVRDSYFRSIFDMQQGTGLAFSFSKISDRQVREILSQDWSGAHYSKRIWQNTNALAGELQNTLLKGVLTGASSGRMANEIQQRFHASYSRALTLTRTESSHCANSAELRRYEETGVKKYRYVATLDSHTSDVCQELDGQEFPVEDASPGTNYPPMHPRCRSTTIAALSPALMQKLERRARDPETGELRTVPADMTYREWYGKYVEGGELTDGANGGIINMGSGGMYRKSKDGKIQPMPKKQLRRIIDNFQRRGGLIQMNEATDKYLAKNHAEAITYNAKTILLKQNPGRASVFEELIHATQYRTGRNDGSYEARLICEIEAQEKLIKNAKAYRLTEEEISQTKEALKAYKEELDRYYKHGGD